MALLADMNLWYSLQWLAQLSFAAVVIWIAWKALEPRSDFKIRVRHGSVAVVYGKVRWQFLNDLTDIVAKEKLESGTITGSAKSKRAALNFTRDIPPPVQQQIRNAWYAGI